MKKLMIFFAFLLFGLASVAQRTFSASTLKEMFVEYQKDSKAFFINRLSDNFRYSNPQGTLLRKSDVAAGGKTESLQTADAQKYSMHYTA